MESLTCANTKFAVDLLKQLENRDKVGNIFVSPFSISAALAMVYRGAKGNTATQMAKVLSFDEVKDSHSAFQQLQTEFKGFHSEFQQVQTEVKDVHSKFQQLLTELFNPKAEHALKIANRLFGEKTYNFLPDFIADTLKYYQAELAPVDFGSAAENVRQEINTWTEEQTAGKIKELLAEGIVDSLTKLVLVNAIYFKGNWAKQFEKRHTQDGQFRINQHEKKPVQMMFQKAKFPFIYVEEVSTQILELPYVGHELSMVILLPEINDDFSGLNKLQDHLTFDRLMNWTNPEFMRVMEIDVSLPKFKLEEQYDLELILSQMGMVDAFDSSKADFTGMTCRNDLVLTKVIHKAFVEVNEEGTEAAAATAAVMMLRCSLMAPSFVADHPFLFFIRHNKTRNILFFGRFSSP